MRVVTTVQQPPLPPQPSPPQTPRAATSSPASASWVINEADVPRTGEQVQAMRIRLSDLQRQLQDAAERRVSIMNRMREAPAAAMSGLEARLAEVDHRILNIEREISRNTALLSGAPSEALIAGTRQAPDPAVIAGNVLDDIVPIVAIITMFVLAPIAYSISRFFWRRSSRPAIAAAPDHATQQRLEHLQQAVDTIAIEVERISEGQRFVTRLLAQRSSADEQART